MIFWWVFKRHFAVIPVIGLRGAAIWYHAGSWVRSCGVSLSASRFRLYFLATFSIRAESFQSYQAEIYTYATVMLTTEVPTKTFIIVLKKYIYLQQLL